LLGKLRGLPEDLQFTTSTNISEIYYGAYRSRNKEKILKAYEGRVFPNLTILPFDSESGRICGQLKARTEHQILVQGSDSEWGKRHRLAKIRKQNMMISICGFTYIEPNWRAIKEGSSRKLFETLTQKSFDIWLGFVFERFCLKHAGICDPTGRIFGLMPHPEGFNHYTNHPDWTKEKEALAR